MRCASGLALGRDQSNVCDHPDKGGELHAFDVA